MKTFTFKYDPQANGMGSLDLMKKAISSGSPHIEEHQLRSASLKALLSVATESRLEMFRLIHDRSPQSLYELSQIVGKDLSYISREAKILESMGLIELVEETVGGRDRIKPVACYDRIIFDFNLDLKKVSNI